MAEHTDVKTVPQQEAPDVQKTTLTVPKDLWLEVRTTALQRGIDAQDIYIEGAREWLAKYRATQREKLQASVQAIADTAIAKHENLHKQEE